MTPPPLHGDELVVGHKVLPGTSRPESTNVNISPANWTKNISIYKNSPDVVRVAVVHDPVAPPPRVLAGKVVAHAQAVAHLVGGDL